MNDRCHYSNFLTRPAKGSRYEFFVCASSILQSELSPPAWYSKLEIDGPVSLSHAREVERYNRAVDRNNAIMERRASEQLAAAGISEERHCEPPVRALLHDLILLQKQSCFLAKDELMAPTLPLPNFSEGVYPKAICQEVIFAADITMGHPGPKTLAIFFNEEKSNKTGNGLDPDHISRALKTIRAEFARKVARGPDILEGILGSLLTAMARDFQALVLMADKAKKNDDLRHLRGADLALAIHDRWNLCECLDRAKLQLGFEQRAA